MMVKRGPGRPRRKSRHDAPYLSSRTRATGSADKALGCVHVHRSADLQLLGLAQQEGKELARRHTWQRSSRKQTFTATATETQSTAIPSDFDRFIDETMFNRTRKRHVYGPLNPQEWQFQKSV
jgi:hypothetical protein